MRNCSGKVADALAEIGRMVGREFFLGPGGLLEIELDGGVACAIEAPAESPHVFLRAVVGRLPSTRTEGIMRRLLQRNFFAQTDPRIWLALSDDAEEVIVCTTRGAEIDSATLSAAIVGLHDEVCAARTILQGVAASSFPQG